MKMLSQAFRWLLATSLVAALSFAGVSSAQDGETSEKLAAEGLDEREAVQQTAASDRGETSAEQAGDEVENAVKERTDDATAERRKKLIDDAVEALDETQKALAALEEGDVEGALDSLAVATGKLDLAVTRNPSLALAPVDVRLVTYDLYATVEEIEDVRERAIDALERGRVQDARALIEGLRSDVVVEVANVPLGTYPAAIKAITPLIDAGKMEEAKAGLQQALNTLVITRHVHPLPIMRTESLLTRAEELAETEARSEEQSAELTKILADARTQLEFAQELGYGEKDDFERFYEQLDEISKKTGAGKSGSGFFDKIRSALRSFGTSSSTTN